MLSTNENHKKYYNVSSVFQAKLLLFRNIPVKRRIPLYHLLVLIYLPQLVNCHKITLEAQ